MMNIQMEYFLCFYKKTVYEKEYFVWNKKQFLLNPINSKTSLLKKKKRNVWRSTMFSVDNHLVYTSL